MKHNAEKSRIIEKSRTKTPCHVVYALWGEECATIFVDNSPKIV